MSEKIFELVDLFLTFLLLGSLIRSIPIVNKTLETIENTLESTTIKIPNKNDHELILGFAKFTGYISLFFIVITFILTYVNAKLPETIDFKIIMYLVFAFFGSFYFYISLKIARPSKTQIINFPKKNFILVLILLAPFLFLAFDLLIDTKILSQLSQSMFNQVLLIKSDYYIPDKLFFNFIAFFCFFYFIVLCYAIGLLGIAQLPYMGVALILKILRHNKKQEKVLFIFLLFFIINKLFLIFLF